MANILICDDDVDIVSALKIYLSNEDYKIYTAFTGKQALDCVKEHEIDLVLMDVMMPEMDGIAATAKLREEYNIPVILLTAKSVSCTGSPSTVTDFSASLSSTPPIVMVSFGCSRFCWPPRRV